MGEHGWIIALVIGVSLVQCASVERDSHKNELSPELQEILKELRSLSDTKRSQTSSTNNIDCDKDDDVKIAAARKWLEPLVDQDGELATRTYAATLISWDYYTNLTDENAAKAAEADVELTEWSGKKVEEAKRYLDRMNRIEKPCRDPEVMRLLNIWVYGQEVPNAKDSATINAISTLGVQLESMYGNAEVVKDGKTYRIEPEFNKLMSTSRDYGELKWAWKSWRDATGPHMRSSFAQMVAKMNKAAKDNGLDNVGVSWRMSGYEKDNIVPKVDALYEEILPLYEQLHAFVRHKLVNFYDSENIDPSGPIPAHILGNMWAQQWTDIMDIVAPFPDVPVSDVTKNMVDQGYTPKKMFELAEKFFTSIGLEPMTDKFWNYSMIVRPNDRPVQCHGSAEEFMTQDDFRIKMCTEVTQDYLQTIHHEMGHIEYFMQYRHQPTIFRNSANSAFHEAVGDTIALSVMTPDHLKRIGLIKGSDGDNKKGGTSKCFTVNKACSQQEKRELNQMMKVALEKIAFLPFGYLIDKWRWDVFSGEIKEEEYNSKWWQYRTKYQGVAAPVPRTEDDFDPGAKYHVPAFVPYIRYFLSFIGQFQFQKALCDAAKYKGELHHCDIYTSIEAGDLLKSVLSLGASEPWPDAMEKFTGQTEFCTGALFEYFSPLYSWLRKYNKDNEIIVGW